ncbi:probable UDP-3-O-acyl-N-acetylglucosamine deacetylase 2 [Tanacetum coccineum]
MAAEFSSRSGIFIESAEASSISVGEVFRIVVELDVSLEESCYTGLTHQEPKNATQLSVAAALQVVKRWPLPHGNRSLRCTDFALSVAAGLLGNSASIPIFDGSAREWVKAIKQVGLTVAMDSNSRSCDKLAPYLTEPVHVSKGDSVIAAFPSKETNISYEINFHHVINASDHIYGVISLASNNKEAEIQILRNQVQQKSKSSTVEEIVETHVADKKDTIEDAIVTMEDKNEDY